MSSTTQTNTIAPDTGISGVFELMYATTDPEYAIKYFNQFGFTEIENASYSANDANILYGYNSNLKSYRLQNGDIDSHGLVRVLHWEEPKNNGVGYTPPRCIGQRLSVMKTNDIYRLKDIYDNARAGGECWFATEPVTDDLFGLNNGTKDFFSRPVVVKENAVYGSMLNHIFFQRYGYHIEGYGTIHDNSALRTSEFTHHDFFVNAEHMSEMQYLSSALGLISEDKPKLDGEWMKGPKAVFDMEVGQAHWYQGFVSPNNICGKLKIFIPKNTSSDKSKYQTVGSLGVTLHSFYVRDLSNVHQSVSNHDLNPSSIVKNEFGEHSFNFTGPGGCSWQILENRTPKHNPITDLKFTQTNN